MKKIYILLLTVFVILSLCGCSGPDNIEDNSTEITSITQLPTDEAMVKDNEAIELIKSFSGEELGLDDETLKQCSFMVQSNGTIIDGEKYIKVAAVIKTKNDNDTYSFDIKGEYFISFSGDTILKKTDNNYSKLK